MAKNRIVRQRRAESDDEDQDLGGDVAMVGTPEDGIQVVTDDEPGNDTVLVEEEAEDWDNPDKDKKGKQQASDSRERESADEEDEDDARLAYDEDEGQNRRPSRRSRRNRSRKHAIDQRDQHIQRLEGMVGELTNRLNGLQGGQMSLAANTIESQLASAKQALALADQELGKAVTEGDGEKYREIQALRDEASQRVWMLSQAQARLRAMPPEQQQQLNGGGQPNGQQRQQPTPQQQQAAAEANRLAEIFLDRHPWFDPQGSDRDSRLARTIDQELAEEGYMSHTKAFWLEFERRCKEEGLGANYRDEDEEDDDRTERRPVRREAPPRRNGVPPTGVVRSSTRPGRGGFVLSQTQVDLLREEGLDGNNLSKEDQARKERIIAKWKQGASALRRESR